VDKVNMLMTNQLSCPAAVYKVSVDLAFKAQGDLLYINHFELTF